MPKLHSVWAEACWS